MREPIAYMREIDAGTDNACFVVCAKGDPGSFAVYARPSPDMAGADDALGELLENIIDCAEGEIADMDDRNCYAAGFEGGRINAAREVIAFRNSAALKEPE